MLGGRRVWVLGGRRVWVGGGCGREEGVGGGGAGVGGRGCGCWTEGKEGPGVRGIWACGRTLLPRMLSRAKAGP